MDCPRNLKHPSWPVEKASTIQPKARLCCQCEVVWFTHATTELATSSAADRSTSHSFVDASMTLTWKLQVSVSGALMKIEQWKLADVYPYEQNLPVRDPLRNNACPEAPTGFYGTSCDRTTSSFSRTHRWGANGGALYEQQLYRLTACQ
jgi:hypothetical protein